MSFCDRLQVKQIASFMMANLMPIYSYRRCTSSKPRCVNSNHKHQAGDAESRNF